MVFDVKENLWPIEKRKRRDGGSVTCRNPSPDNNLWSPKSQIRKTTKKEKIKKKIKKKNAHYVTMLSYRRVRMSI